MLLIFIVSKLTTVKHNEWGFGLFWDIVKIWSLVFGAQQAAFGLWLVLWFVFGFLQDI